MTDGEHIIYVNGSMKTKDTALGRLMSDFYCTDAKDMNYKELSERVQNYKETEEGVDTMCDVLDEIADTSGLSIEKVRELAGNKSA